MKHLDGAVDELNRMKKDAMEELLRQNGSARAAADYINVPYTTFRRRCKTLGIDINNFDYHAPPPSDEKKTLMAEGIIQMASKSRTSLGTAKMPNELSLKKMLFQKYRQVLTRNYGMLDDDGLNAQDFARLVESSLKLGQRVQELHGEILNSEDNFTQAQVRMAVGQTRALLAKRHAQLFGDEEQDDTDGA